MLIKTSVSVDTEESCVSMCAILLAVSSRVNAAEYARPFTALINGVEPSRSLHSKKQFLNSSTKH